MNDIVAFSVFCEDVRHETNGLRTLVGVLGDSVAVPQLPGAFPKLAVFSRVSMPIARDVEEVTQSFVDPQGDEIGRYAVEPQLLEQSRQEAYANGNPVYGVSLDMRVTMLHVNSPGVYSVSVEVDGVKVTSFLNVKLSEASGE